MKATDATLVLMLAAVGWLLLVGAVLAVADHRPVLAIGLVPGGMLQLALSRILLRLSAHVRRFEDLALRDPSGRTASRGRDDAT